MADRGENTRQGAGGPQGRHQFTPAQDDRAPLLHVHGRYGQGQLQLFKGGRQVLGQGPVDALVPHEATPTYLVHEAVGGQILEAAPNLVMVDPRRVKGAHQPPHTAAGDGRRLETAFGKGPQYADVGKPAGAAAAEDKTYLHLPFPLFVRQGLDEGRGVGDPGIQIAVLHGSLLRDLHHTPQRLGREVHLAGVTDGC